MPTLMHRMCASGRFLYVQHRALNSLGSVEAALAVRDVLRGVRHRVGFALEGDLGWLQDGTKIHVFFYHPTLPWSRIRNGKRLASLAREGAVVPADEALEASRGENLVIELKGGSPAGAAASDAALERLAQFLADTGGSRRVIFDSFYLDLLARAKERCPEAGATLHAIYAWRGGRVIQAPTSVRDFFLGDRRFDAAFHPAVDGVVAALPAPTTWLTALGERLRAAGKHLVLGRVKRAGAIAEARATGAVGGYVRFEPEEAARALV